MKNIKRYLTFTDLFKIKNKKLKIIEYVITGFILLYAGLICYPDVLFGHSIRYKNFSVHSTGELDNNIYNVLNNAGSNLFASGINDTTITHKIYLCNNYSLYSFMALKSRKAFACNYSFINNIFIANCNVKENEAYKNDDNDSYIRQLSELIVHETTHTLIEKKLGLWKYWNLERWINEGYSETIGYNEDINIKAVKEFLKTNENNEKLGVLYKKYYYAVAYLMQIEKMKFEDIVVTELTLNDVLNKIEAIKTEN